MLKKNQQMKKRKKMLYELMCCKEYQPMRAKELAILLQIPSGKREELHKILDLLLEEGKISINKRGRYEAVRKIEKKKERVKEQETQREEIFRKGHCYTGTFISHPRGFGFVQVEEMEGARDIFIPEEGIGIRIEDTLLVTEDGCEVLTADIPKTVEEIEAFMQS